MCTLCCQFLWIVHFWLSVRYSLTFSYIHTHSHKKYLESWTFMAYMYIYIVEVTHVLYSTQSEYHKMLLVVFFVFVFVCLLLMERELLTLPEHLSSLPIFSGVRVTRFLVLCVMFCRSLFVLWSLFFWPLCSSILITPFGIFKLFLDFVFTFHYSPDLFCSSNINIVVFNTGEISIKTNLICSSL